MSDEAWNLFNCHRCGKCCTEIGLPYDAQRLPDIAKFLGIDLDEVLNRYYGHRTTDGMLEFDDQKRKPCPFLEKHGDRTACGIHSVRPSGCRAYPIDTDFGDGGIGCPAYQEVKVKLAKLHGA